MAVAIRYCVCGIANCICPTNYEDKVSRTEVEWLIHPITPFNNDRADRAIRDHSRTKSVKLNIRKQKQTEALRYWLSNFV